jgi:LAO/AO transport system kinase
MGDDIQTFKAGILEIADILVVNKADRPGADRTIKSLEMMLHLGEGRPTRHHGRVLSTEVVETGAAADWQVPVQPTTATSGEGMADLLAAIQRHWQHLRESGEWLLREKARSRREVEHLLQARLLRRLRGSVPLERLEGLITAVAARQTDPYTAVAAIEQLLGEREQRENLS